MTSTIGRGFSARIERKSISDSAFFSFRFNPDSILFLQPITKISEAYRQPVRIPYCDYRRWAEKCQLPIVNIFYDFIIFYPHFLSKNKRMSIFCIYCNFPAAYRRLFSVSPCAQRGCPACSGRSGKKWCSRHVSPAPHRSAYTARWCASPAPPAPRRYRNG